ncbi:MAG: hypothetical protein R2752_07960 [Vicinamibacterales bacterium]
MTIIAVRSAPVPAPAPASRVSASALSPVVPGTRAEDVPAPARLAPDGVGGRPRRGAHGVVAVPAGGADERGLAEKAIDRGNPSDVGHLGVAASGTKG